MSQQRVLLVEVGRSPTCTVGHDYSERWPGLFSFFPFFREFCRVLQRFRSSKRYLRYRSKINYVRTKQVNYPCVLQLILRTLDYFNIDVPGTEVSWRARNSNVDANGIFLRLVIFIFVSLTANGVPHIRAAGFFPRNIRICVGSALCTDHSP